MGVGDRLGVAVLFGGTSAEHDVSVCSGLNVLDALDPARYLATPVYVDSEGHWHFGVRPDPPSLVQPAAAAGAASTVRQAGPSTPADVAVASAGRPGVLERLRGDPDIDVVFIALHGPGGEDGAVQGLLTVAGVPYTGSGVLASALAMDKPRTKRLLSTAGVPMPVDRTVSRTEWAADESRAERSAAEAGLPCVVKPVAGGSSFGTRIVGEPSELRAAVVEALAHDETAMIEPFVAGTEVTCGVLGGGTEPCQALPLTEIVPIDGEFFDFRAKYTLGACTEITPARVDDGVAADVQRHAVRAHELIGCEGMSRSDFILGTDGPVMLELNTIPGMTETSLLPQGAAAAGIPFAALVERLVRSALLRGIV